MNEQQWLAERFEAHRTHLRAVAYRMLGSHAEAEDAVQDAWVRFSRADSSDVDDVGGWLTTIVSRVCLNMLQSRRSRREEPLDDQAPVPKGGIDPEREAVLADSVGSALLVVLETLAPAERLAFVLHDLFAVPFDEIAAVIERSPAAARQLASRARRRVQAAQPALIDGAVGAVWAPGGKPRAVFHFTISDGKIASIEMQSDPEEVGLLGRRNMFTGFDGEHVVWADGSRDPVDAVLFATGYRPSLDYLHPLGVLADDGTPQHAGGISTHPGLVYVGLEFQRSFSSNTLRGVYADAEYVMAPLAAHAHDAGRIVVTDAATLGESAA
ncbi:MAG: sigma-70 family RNA polymerase sigma factor [Actinophytocola sp.]|nr:sigma-70 family RNA polymerase sigma factor [Actinophytocola sp.]